MAAWLALLLVAFLALPATGSSDDEAATKICVAPMAQPCPAPLVSCFNPAYGDGCAPNMPVADAGRGPVGLS